MTSSPGPIPRASRAITSASVPFATPTVRGTPRYSAASRSKAFTFGPRMKIPSGIFILGPNVKAFEREAAEYLGVPRTVGVANGTDALVIALDALGIGPGDEVICPAFTFYATAESIARRGATPVFADIDPETLNLDPEDVAARVTDRTRALMPVHLFGRVMPLARLAELDVPILEDAAQAFGAEGVARTGVLSTFSFYPSKN